MMDEGFRRAARARRGAEAVELQAMLGAKRSGAAEQLGFASFYDYAEAVLEMGGREVFERVRVAEAMEVLPRLREALASGQICFSAVRELSRVCVPATEEAWIAAARGHSVRKVERLVSGHVPGDLPEDPVDPAVARHTLTLEVDAATQVLFKEMRRRLEADAGHRLEDSALIAEMARAVLAGGAREPSAPSYQIAISVCERCEQATLAGAGQVVAIDAKALERASCDAHWIDAHVEAEAKSVSPRTRRAVLARDHHRCRVPGCRSSVFLDVHHLIYQSNGGLHHRTNLLTSCGLHHAAVHEGRLVIRGTTSDTATFFHADGTTPFGCPRGQQPALAAPPPA